MSKPVLIAGFEVDFQEERYDVSPCVTMHRRGSTDRAW